MKCAQKMTMNASQTPSLKGITLVKLKYVIVPTTEHVTPRQTIASFNASCCNAPGTGEALIDAAICKFC